MLFSLLTAAPASNHGVKANKGFERSCEQWKWSMGATEVALLADRIPNEKGVILKLRPDRIHVFTCDRKLCIGRVFKNISACLTQKDQRTRLVPYTKTYVGEIYMLFWSF